MEDQHFQEKIDILNGQSHNQGHTANDLIELIVNRPDRSEEVIALVSHPLIDWNFTDVRNMWCALIITHDEIGTNGFTHQQWEYNCRKWLGAQSQLIYECDQKLSKLALGYGSAKHAINSVDIILSQAQKWAGEQGRDRTAQKLASAALAHALDGREETGAALLDKVMSTTDLIEVGDKEKLPWIQMWANVAADGHSWEHIHSTLQLMVRHGVDLYQLDSGGRDVWDWLAEQSRERSGTNLVMLAHIAAALLNEDWPLAQAREAGAQEALWKLLDRHPVLLREKLMGLAGKREQDIQEQEEHRIAM